MSKVPVRRDELNRKLTAFIAWLNEYGAEIGQPTNPYEVVRYRAYWRDTKTAGTHIVYAKENGLLTWTGGSLGHYREFLRGSPLNGMQAVVTPAEREVSGKTKSQIRREMLSERDGDECWFCGKPVGDDCTIEHLVPRSRGGVNHLDNYALAHRQCNADAADLPLTAKIEIRNRLRSLDRQS